MSFLALFGLGVLAGLLLSRVFAIPPEQQTVCIMNCADGSVHRQVCISTQETQCFDDLRSRCDSEPEE